MTKIGRKYLYDYFKRQTSEISHRKTLTWLTKGYFKRENEYFPITEETAISITIGALGTVPKVLEWRLKEFEIGQSK